MITLAVVGAKNSGKTAVMEGLIRYLTGRGYRVATVKHTSHRHRFDTPGKDSFRHRQAGAGLTVAMSGEEIAVFSQTDLLDVRRIQDVTEAQFDIWLIEGYRSSALPKVFVTRLVKEFPEALPENIIATIGPERIGDSPAHFVESDYDGLGSFIIETLLGTD